MAPRGVKPGHIFDQFIPAADIREKLSKVRGHLVWMPMRFLEVIAPANADVWSRAALPLGEPAPAFAPLSMDPAGSFIEVQRWFSYGVIVAASTVLGVRRGIRWAASSAPR